ncbi:MAG TPA: monovalent cation/H+ antiporter complex subunit F [Deinococcales bacterium]|nr:monovalent cation/H+ antiporter complex subunit F [Deinococcales bacterium]
MVVNIAFTCIILALLMTCWRLARGPTLGDRIAALDFLGVGSAVFIVLLAMRTGFTAFLDAALIVSILGFLSTLALTRYIMSRGAQK